MTVTSDGARALAQLKRSPFDAVITDWMMPEMDGIQLVGEIRARLSPPPVIVMVTAIGLPKARDHALEAGADEFVSKPYLAREILSALKVGLARRDQPGPKRLARSPIKPKALPPFVGLVVAASAGGPAALTQFFSDLPGGLHAHAAAFVVLHGPDWMLSSFPARLEKDARCTALLAENDAEAAAGVAYLAPGDRHLTLEPGSVRMKVAKTPLENFIRPAADPLFRTAATTFGRFCVAVVLTGMGRDGTKGAAHVAAAGGLVLAQDPATATAPSMPRTIVDEGLAKETAPIPELATITGDAISDLALELQAAARS